MSLNEAQRAKLLEPIHAQRVFEREGPGKRTLSYVAAWEIRAHLSRIFGIGGWSADTIKAEPVGSGDTYMGHSVTLRLTIFSIGPEGQDVTYTETAISAGSGAGAERMDMAVKTAASDALKRAAMNLGDQFGLSLYNGKAKFAKTVSVDLSRAKAPVDTKDVEVKVEGEGHEDVA